MIEQMRADVRKLALERLPLSTLPELRVLLALLWIFATSQILINCSGNADRNLETLERPW